MLSAAPAIEKRARSDMVWMELRVVVWMDGCDAVQRDALGTPLYYATAASEPWAGGRGPIP